MGSDKSMTIGNDPGGINDLSNGSESLHLRVECFVFTRDIYALHTQFPSGQVSNLEIPQRPRASYVSAGELISHQH